MNAQKIRRLIATGMVLAVSSGMVACKDKTVAVKKQENNNNDKNEEENKEQEQEVFTEEDKKKEELDNLEIENIKGKHGSFVVTKYKEKKQGKILNIQTYLNVRTEPTKSAEAIEKLHNDDTVNVLGKTGEWYQIELNEKVGYIHSNYVRVEGEAYNYNPDMDKTSVYVQDSQVNNSGIVYVTPVTSEDNTNPNIVVKPSKPTTSNKPSTSNKPNVKPEEKPTTPSTPNKPGDKPEEKPSTPEEKPVENTAPVITGNSLEIKGLNSTFTVEMLELKATDKEDGDLTSKIVIEENTVDTSKTGEYKVVASVTDSQGLKTTVEIKVTVVEVKDDVIVEAGVINSAPVITGKDITIEQYSTFNKDMLEIKCEDKEDGTLTYEVIKNNVNVAEAGTYDFTVKATDGKGASTMKTFKVTVTAKKLNTAPVIHVTNKQVDLAVGDTWSLDLHGVTATDAEDGVITDIRVDGTVDTSKAGTYFVDLVAVDSEELISGRVTLTVIVHEKSVDINSVPTMEVKNETVTLVKGDKWSLDLHGVSANDKEDGKLEVKVEGKVDTNTVGTYKITVTAVDSQGAKVVRQLTVIVNDKKNSVPVITAQDIQINKGQRYDVALHNAQATDAEDGNLTSKITYTTTVDTTRVGKYQTTFKVQDSQGVEASITVNVEVLAVNPTLTCKDTVEINQGDNYSTSLIGATAKDANGIDITNSITFSGDVNPSVAGTYYVNVTATDADGLTATKKVTVVVKEVKPQGMLATSQEFYNIVVNEMDRLVNQHRANNGVKALEIRSIARECAREKAKHMADNGYFDHTWNGLHMWEMNSKYEGSNICGENIYMGSIDLSKEYTKDEAKAFALRIFNKWKESTGHNNMMLDSWNNAYGFGFVITSDGTVYAVQEFIID
ncbi:immunoglobulin-like domain-containing protein [uncultured Clostridium sp.]|uniref:immunoglobulin-like domain-containing protein n=1 Tax=uncultured Clostridium sp. TaxID=59620 RepID=UPI002620257B|nr:immunoglobulin-like domain-containing protein [uncultured Clostridium sp.]